MSLSLQEQLLKAGIAKPKQAKKARRDKAQHNKAARKSGKPQDTAEQKLSREVDAAHAAKRAADRKRAQAVNTERDQREKKRQALQIMRDNRIAIEPPSADEPAYSYTIKGRIRHVPVSREQRQRLADGKLAIVRYDGDTALVDTATAERLEKIIPKSVFRNSPKAQASATHDADDPYAGYEVPDDLMW